MFLFFMNQCNGLTKVKYSCKGARYKKWVNSCRVLNVVGMCLLIYCKLFDWSIVCYVDIQVSNSCIDGCKVFHFFKVFYQTRTPWMQVGNKYKLKKKSREFSGVIFPEIFVSSCCNFPLEDYPVKGRFLHGTLLNERIVTH